MNVSQRPNYYTKSLTLTPEWKQRRKNDGLRPVETEDGNPWIVDIEDSLFVRNDMTDSRLSLTQSLVILLHYLPEYARKSGNSGQRKRQVATRV